MMIKNSQIFVYLYKWFHRSSLDCLASTRRPLPHRRAADLLEKEVNEDPNLRGQNVRFRVNKPDRRFVGHLVVWQYPHKRAVTDLCVHAPERVHRDANPGPRRDAHARAVITGNPVVSTRWRKRTAAFTSPCFQFSGSTVHENQHLVAGQIIGLGWHAVSHQVVRRSAKNTSVIGQFPGFKTTVFDREVAKREVESAFDQIRLRIARNIKAVVSQRLVPTTDGSGRVPAAEVLTETDRTFDYIMDPELTPKLEEVMAEGAYYGMRTFDQCLLQYFRDGVISFEEALNNASHPTDFRMAAQKTGLRTA